MKSVSCSVALALASALSAHAASPSSANYSVPTDSIDAGGARATTAAYSNDGSIGGVAGRSTVVSPSEIARHGYVGQLIDPASVVISASPATLNENSTRQLAASLGFDDGTGTPLAAASVSWSVLSGPLSGVNASGLATATNVYQDTPATVQGAFSGYSGTLGLFVLNTGLDDFAFYAGDGVDDSWQVQYFGENNPNALAGADPDGDGQTNFFEYVALTIPTDAASKFRLNLDPVPDRPTQMNIRFSPVSEKRLYTVLSRPIIHLGSFNTVTGLVNDASGERTVTDTNATETAKFYRVKIELP